MPSLLWLNRSHQQSRENIVHCSSRDERSFLKLKLQSFINDCKYKQDVFFTLRLSIQNVSYTIKRKSPPQMLTPGWSAAMSLSPQNNTDIQFQCLLLHCDFLTLSLPDPPPPPPPPPPPVCSRLQHVRGSSCLHSVSVRGPEQEEGHQGDLHPLHLRHRHQECAVCVRRRHRRHHQEQPERLWSLLRMMTKEEENFFSW